MAAEKSSSSAASCSKPGGFSYANAVLNFKNDAKSVEREEKRPNDAAGTAEFDKCNKENERDVENVNGKAVAVEEKIEYMENANENTADQEDDFIDYSGSKRKKKKKKEVAFQTASTVAKSVVAPSRFDRGFDRSRPRRRDRATSHYSEPDSNAACDNVTYVEAPVPKVNPWTVNKNAASVIKGERNSTTAADSQPTDACKR